MAARKPKKPRQVTEQEAFERLGRVNELVAECSALVASLAVSPLRVGPLTAAIWDARLHAEYHYQAAELLLSHPLATEFPDGEPAPATLTARQVHYLAALAYGNRYSREALDLPPSRACTEPTVLGEKCGQFSMRFSERAVCWAHATPAERERNRKANEAWALAHPDHQI